MRPVSSFRPREAIANAPSQLGYCGGEAGDEPGERGEVPGELGEPKEPGELGEPKPPGELGDPKALGEVGLAPGVVCVPPRPPAGVPMPGPWPPVGTPPPNRLACALSCSSRGSNRNSQS